jgi:dihydrofolate reductase
MAKLTYGMIASLDGYTADESGNFDWAAPDEEVHAFVNDLERDTGTYLYGRRMYETMVYWETFVAEPDEPACVVDYAQIWQAADKIVYSSSLGEVSSTRTRLEPTFDPESVRQLKATSDHGLSIGGPDLAGQALAAGLIDDIYLFVVPVVVGGGTPALPAKVRANLELQAVDRFAGGVVHLHYRIAH